MVWPVGLGHEETLYDAPPSGELDGLAIGLKYVLDEGPILRFWHLLDEHDRMRTPLGVVYVILTDKGRMLKLGTMIDNTLVAAANIYCYTESK